MLSVLKNVDRDNEGKWVWAGDGGRAVVSNEPGLPKTCYPSTAVRCRTDADCNADGRSGEHCVDDFKRCDNVPAKTLNARTACANWDQGEPNTYQGTDEDVCVPVERSPNTPDH